MGGAISGFSLSVLLFSKLAVIVAAKSSHMFAGLPCFVATVLL